MIPFPVLLGPCLYALRPRRAGNCADSLSAETLLRMRLRNMHAQRKPSLSIPAVRRRRLSLLSPSQLRTVARY